MSDTTRISYGYHQRTSQSRKVRLNAAVREARAKFPDALSVAATLDPDGPATAPILVEVTIPTSAVARYYR